jgi:hypothetical protein
MNKTSAKMPSLFTGKMLYLLAAIAATAVLIPYFAVSGKSELLWRGYIQLKDPGLKRCLMRNSLPTVENNRFAICAYVELNSPRFNYIVYDSANLISQPPSSNYEFIKHLKNYAVRDLKRESNIYYGYFGLVQNHYTVSELGGGFYLLRFDPSSSIGWLIGFDGDLL